MRSSTPGEVLAIDVVEVNVSKSLRDAIAKATKSPADCHLLLSLTTIPVLQGIGTRNDLFARECSVLIKTIYDNGHAVLCPGPEKELSLP